MNDGSKEIQFVGRPRRVIGLCLLALGVLVSVQDIWIGLVYHPAFGSEERIRFVFWLWAGTVLILAGCWIAFRLRAARWALLVVVLSLGLIGYSYGRWWS